MEAAAPSSFSSCHLFSNAPPALHLSPAPPPPSSPPQLGAEDAESAAIELAQLLRAMGKKLVCIDFDATLVRVHTGGAWTRSASELLPHVRPLFLQLVPRLVHCEVHVAVVTFSPQVALIRQVLALAFPAPVAQRLIVRGDDASWALAHTDALGFFVASLWQTSGGRHLDRSCKLPFVISAALEASHERGECVRNCDTLLVDDDAANIRVVNDSGIAGVYFDPHESQNQRPSLFTSLLQQVRRFHATTGTGLGNQRKDEAAPVSPQLPVSASPTVPASPLQTPSKKQPTARMVRLMASPESRFLTTTTTSATSVAQLRHHGHGSGTGGGVGRTSRFHLCTPSPVLKLRSTVDMGRPRSKRSVRLMRNIESDLQELHLPLKRTLPQQQSPATLKSTPTKLLMTLDELPTAPSSPPPLPV